MPPASIYPLSLHDALPIFVAMTDGQDCGSLLDGARLLDASARSEAVLHWIYVSSGGDFDPNSVGAWCTPTDAGEVDFVGQRSEEHTSDLQSPCNLVCRLLL